jgi:hypothetical protein
MDMVGGECLTVYYNRLHRDGWKLLDHSERVIMEFGDKISAKNAKKQDIE